jgi:guanylate kinase
LLFVWNTAEIAGCHVIVEPGRFPLKMSAKPADPDAAPMSAAATAANARLTFEELSQLNERKLELKRQHNGYMEKHPEITRILADFMCAALLEKPDDVFSFAEAHFSAFEGKQEGHRPIVVCGPSGVGKGTLISRLVKDYPDAFGFSISHTTRAPRQGEADGVNYHFVEKPVFERLVKEDKFIEHANVHNEWYGTSVSSVGAVRSAGKVCVLDIDVRGAKKVKTTNIAPRYIFIKPPSLEELESRLRDRSSESEEDLNRRLENAVAEIEYGTRAGNFHKVLVNDDVEACYVELQHLLLEWYPHLEGFAGAAASGEQ